MQENSRFTYQSFLKQDKLDLVIRTVIIQNIKTKIINMKYEIYNQFGYYVYSLQLTPTCEKMLLHCMWAGQVVPCMKLFQLRRTNQGYCCVFNYVMDWNDLGRLLFYNKYITDI